MQGVPGAAVAAMLEAVERNERMVGGALGDAMSVNVLTRLLPRALYAAGLLAHLPDDPLEGAWGLTA